MSIKVIKGKEIPLKRPTFLCDYILKKNVPSPLNLLVDGFKVVVVNGFPGSGKTSFLFGLFAEPQCLKRVWNNIILVAPSESLASMKNNIFKGLDDNKFYNNLDDILAIEQQIRGYSAEDETTCLIIDDMMTSLKDANVERTLCNLMANRRHLKLSIFLISQLMERIPLKCRKLINTLIVMYKPSNIEMKLITDEFMQTKDYLAEQVYKIVFKKKFDFLLIDMPSHQIYGNFDKIVIE
jgi:hypothetical protein